MPRPDAENAISYRWESAVVTNFVGGRAEGEKRTKPGVFAVPHCAILASRWHFSHLTFLDIVGSTCLKLAKSRVDLVHDYSPTNLGESPPC